MRKQKILLALVIFLIVLPLVSADLTDGLVAFYSFDSDYTDNHSSYDLSKNSDPTHQTTNCALGGCYEFDGADDYFYIENNAFQTVSGSVSLWVYQTDVDELRQPFSDTTDTSGWGGLGINTDTTADADVATTIKVGGSTYTAISSSGIFAVNTWTLVTVTYDTTTGILSLYINGTFVDDVDTGGGDIQYGQVIMEIGGVYLDGYSSAYTFGGRIDEVGWWGRALTPDEVTELYNNGDAFAYPFPPPLNVAPAISIISPDDNTFSADVTPEITFLVTDPEEATTDCNIFFDDVPFGQNASVLNNTNTIIGLNASLGEGNKTYFINCSDGTNTNVSETRTIIIDTIDPTINLNYPVNNAIYEINDLIFEYYVYDNNLQNCSLYFDNNYNQTNETIKNPYRQYSNITNNTEVITQSIPFVMVKEFVFNRSVFVDSATNVIWSAGYETYSTYNFTYYDNSMVGVSNYQPDATPTTKTYINPNPDMLVKNISVWLSITSTSGDSHSHEKDDVIYLRQDNYTFQIDDIVDGYHNWSIKCYDEAGNYNQTDLRDFRIDTTDPVIESYSPDNNILAWNNNISFDILVSDAGFIYNLLNNITDPVGTLVYTFNYTDTGGAEESAIRLNGSVKLNLNGTYVWDKLVCDGHTDKDITDKVKDPFIDLSSKKIDFKDFKFLPKDPNNIEKAKIEKLKDRYTFGWDLKQIKKTQFDLISNYKLDYFPKSQQFIIGEKKIWIDFVGLESLKIIKVSDYHYIIETTPKTKEILAKSVGALNCIYETSYFYINNMGLNLTAKDYSSNATINNFTATILDLSWEKSTTEGYIEFNLSAGNYSILINASGFALKNETIEIIGHENLTSYLYGANSVLVNIYDQDSGALINTASVLFDANLTYYQAHSTTNGSIYVSGLPTANYVMTISSTGYVDSYYQISLTGSNYITLNAYLLNTSNLVVITIKSDETDKFIEGAGVVVTRKVNGSWVSVGSQTTDGVGAVRFGMKEEAEYKLLISASGYNTKEFTLKPYESSYTIYLVRDTPQIFFDLFNKMSYRIMPFRLVIPPYSYDNPISCFNLTTSSTSGYIDFFGLSGSLNGSAMNISNITGSPNGATAQFCLNLTFFNDYNITIDYWIKVNGEDLWTNQRQYFITNLTEGSLTPWFNVSSYSMVGWLQTYGSEIPITWKIIIMVGVAVGLMLTFAMWLPPAVLGFIGVSVIGVMSFMWFPNYIIISMILIVVMAIMYLIMEGRE